MSGTVCGLLGELSVMLRVAVRLPTDWGVNVTLIVQLAPGATVAPQVVVWEKSGGLLPPRAMPDILSATDAVLVRVITNGGLLVPTICFPKDRLGGESTTVVCSSTEIGPVAAAITKSGSPSRFRSATARDCKAPP